MFFVHLVRHVGFGGAVSDFDMGLGRIADCYRDFLRSIDSCYFTTNWVKLEGYTRACCYNSDSDSCSASASCFPRNSLSACTACSDCRQTDRSSGFRPI